MNILVLCTGNSARSILLEVILNDLGKGQFKSFSAGSKPTGRVNPASIALLKSKEFETCKLRSKSWDEFSSQSAPKMDLVITVCGNARDEECPYWAGAPIQTHWGVDDPADVTEPADAVVAAFNEAYDILHFRAQKFMDLDFKNQTPQELQKQIHAIGTLMP